MVGVAAIEITYESHFLKICVINDRRVIMIIEGELVNNNNNSENTCGSRGSLKT